MVAMLRSILLSNLSHKEPNIRPITFVAEHHDSSNHGAGLVRHPALDSFCRRTYGRNREVVSSGINYPVKVLYHAAAPQIRGSAKSIQYL